MTEQQSNWDESFKAGRDYNPINQILLDSVLFSIHNDKKTAIDLGCGTGDAVIKLAKRGMSVTGVDWSPDALEKAKTRAVESAVQDLVLCKLVVAFVSDKKAFLEAAKNLLNKQGYLVLQTPVLHDNVEYGPEDKPGIAVKYNEFKELLSEVFESVNEFDHSYYGDKGDLVTFILK